MAARHDASVRTGSITERPGWSRMRTEGCRNRAMGKRAASLAKNTQSSLVARERSSGKPPIAEKAAVLTNRPCTGNTVPIKHASAKGRPLAKPAVLSRRDSPESGFHMIAGADTTGGSSPLYRSSRSRSWETCHGSSTSSESKKQRYMPRAWRAPRFRATPRSEFACRNTRISGKPADKASEVPSVEPSSTTMTSVS